MLISIHTYELSDKYNVIYSTYKTYIILEYCYYKYGAKHKYVLIVLNLPFSSTALHVMGGSSKSFPYDTGIATIHSTHHLYRHPKEQQHYHPSLKAGSRGSCSEASSAYSGSDTMQVRQCRGLS